MKTKHGVDVWVVRKGKKYSLVQPGKRTGWLTNVSQRIAIMFGRLLARKNHSELFIQGKDGRIRARDSHGFDSPRRRG